MTTYIPLEKDYVISGTNRIPARCLVTDSVFFQLFHYPIAVSYTHLDVYKRQAPALMARTALSVSA